MEREPRDLWFEVGSAVELVTKHGVAEVRQVHADLVGAARAQLGLDQRRRTQPLDGTDRGLRRLAATPGGEGAPACARSRPADRSLDEALPVEVAGHEREVTALGGVNAELALEVLGGSVGAGQDHDSRGVAVEAVHDEQAAYQGSRPRKGDVRAGQHGVALAFRGWVDDQARWLVHDHDVGIVEEQLDGRRARQRRAAGELRMVLDAIAGVDPGTRVDHDLVVDGDVAVDDLVLGVAERAAQEGLHGTGEALGVPLHVTTLPPHRNAGVTDRPSPRAARGGAHGHWALAGSCMLSRMEGSPAAVGTLLERAVSAGLTPGLVGLATRVDEGVGLSWCAGNSAVGGPPTTPDLRYDLASLTKPLATATLLLLARRDGLALSSPLGALLPELQGGPWGAVELWQCAGHCAGFPAWAPLYAVGERSREGYLRSLGRLEPVARPGAKVEYSCPGFIALGLALERAGGATLDVLFRELVTEPLGVADELSFAPQLATPIAGGQTAPFVERALLAQLGVQAEPPDKLADAVSCDDGNTRGLGGAAGNAGLFGTAAAVAQLAAEYLPGGGALLTAEEAETATRCVTPGLEQARGIGWQLAATPGSAAGPSLSEGAFGHNGFTGTSLWIDGARREVYVLLGNRLHPGGRLPELHPLRRRFHALAAGVLAKPGGED